MARENHSLLPRKHPQTRNPYANGCCDSSLDAGAQMPRSGSRQTMPDNKKNSLLEKLAVIVVLLQPEMKESGAVKTI